MAERALMPSIFHLLRDSALYRPNPTFGNPRWNDAGIRVLILRLSPFRDAQRSTPHIFLAREVKRGAPDSYVDMAFLPAAADRKLLASHAIPLILGIQSRRPLEDFDLVLVSNSCVPELVNLPYLLRMSRIPLWSRERDEKIPAIILGGSSVSAAQGIVAETGDCMADALFFGEGEAAVSRLAGFWRGGTGLSKREKILAAADKVEGLWPAGDLSRTVRRAIGGRESTREQGLPYPVLPGTEAGTARLEITRGCPCRCSFCFEGYDRKPFRQLDAAALMDAARALKSGSGAGTLEIASFNFNTHEDLTGLLQGLSGLFHRVNAMSQRLDILARTPGLVELERAYGKRSFTVGMEGISGKQRRFLHKSLDEEDILRAMKDLIRPGTREVKLFFILTGHEDEKDFGELAAFVRRLKELGRGEGPRIIFSFGMLVRMPFTPLRYDALLLREKIWRPIIGKAKSICETNGCEFRLSTPWLDYLLIQTLAMGDYRMRALMELLAENGAIYDEHFPPAAVHILEGWLAADPGMREMAEEKKGDHVFALDFLENPEERVMLHDRFLRAKAGTDEGYCRRGSPNGCGDCPGCTLKDRVMSPASSDTRTRASVKRISELMAHKAGLAPFPVRLRIPPEAAEANPEWRDAYLLREFLARFPEQLENVLSIEERTITEWLGRGFRGAWFGEGLAAITAWDAEAAASALAGNEGGHVFQPIRASESFRGTFSSLALEMHLSEALFPDAERHVLDALRSQHVSFTLRRDGESYGLVVAEKTLKKSSLLGGIYTRTPKGLRVRIHAGRKLDMGKLLAEFPGVTIEIKTLSFEDSLTPPEACG
jgi:hypothetical protein